MSTEKEEEETRKSGGETGCLIAGLLTVVVILALAGMGGTISPTFKLDPMLAITNIDTIQNNTTNNTYNNPPSAAPASLPAAEPLSGQQSGECIYSGGSYPGEEKFVMWQDSSKPTGYGYAFINRSGERIELGPPAGKVSCKD